MWKGRKSPEPQSLNPTSSPLIGHHGSHVSSSSTLIGHSAVSLSGHVTATSQAPSRDSPSPDGKFFLYFLQLWEYCRYKWTFFDKDKVLQIFFIDVYI